jgi:hypothetical protein
MKLLITNEFISFMCQHLSLHTHMHPYRIVGGSDAIGVRRPRGQSSTRRAGSGRNRGRRVGRWAARVSGLPAILVPERQAPEHFTPCGLQISTLHPLCLMHYVIGVSWNRWCLSTTIFLGYLDISCYPVRSNVKIYA